MNKQEIIDAAMQIATGMGGDASTSPVLDADMTAEDLLPLVFRHVYTQLLLTNGMRYQDLLVEHTVSVVNGVGDIPANILTEYQHLATLPEYPYSSLCQSPHDFNRPKFTSLLCYFVFQNGKFITDCTDPEATENIKLQAVTMPELPASVSAEVPVGDRELDAIIYTLARAIRGEIKLAQ